MTHGREGGREREGERKGRAPFRRGMFKRGRTNHKGKGPNDPPKKRHKSWRGEVTGKCGQTEHIKEECNLGHPSKAPCRPTCTLVWLL